METFLTFEETRIIGSLIEKKITTPEYYPLTVNSLKNACNQKSNRNPVISFDENIIESTLTKLRDKTLVTRVTGSDIRVPKYRQIFTEELKLKPDEIAVICVLMLRGSQTPGEIKTRTGRLFNFDNLLQIEETINGLMNREKPLVTKLSRQAGMKESRYAHLLAGEPIVENVQENKEDSTNQYEERITALESEIKNLESKLEILNNQFVQFRKQFE